MKKSVIAFVLAILVVGSMGFGAFAQEELTLRISWWGSQERHNRTLEVIEMFEAQYPHITIEAEFAGWENYWERIAAQVAGGNMPDIIQHDYSVIRQYIQRGLLEDLSPYAESGLLDLSNVDEAALAGGWIDGGLYGISLGSNSIAGIYSPLYFQATGIPEPHPNWTWDDYAEAARLLKERAGVYANGRFFAGEAPFHGLQHYLRQRGYSIYSEDGKSLGYDDDDLFAEFFRMQLDLTKEGAVPGVAERSEITSAENDFLMVGKAAIAWQWSNLMVAMGALLDPEDLPDLRLALVPKDPNQVQEGQYIKPSQFFTVAKSSEHKEAAVKFIDFVTNDLEANKVLMAERGIPISAKVREGLIPMLNSIQLEAFEFIDLVSKHSSPIEPPEPAGNAEVVRTLHSLEEMILFEVITPEQAAKEFRREATRILQRNQ